VVLIVRRLRLPGAFLAGLIFALRPVCVEAVAWISEQKSTLSAVFYLAALLLYLRFDRTRKIRDYAMALALFVCALLSKTVTATLPAALLAIFWWQHGRLAWKRDALPLLPWFGIGAGAGLLTSWVERAFIGAKGAGFALTLGQRCLIAGRALWFYLGKLIVPAGLTFTYPHWTVDTSAAGRLPFCCYLPARSSPRSDSSTFIRSFIPMWRITSSTSPAFRSSFPWPGPVSNSPSEARGCSPRAAARRHDLSSERHVPRRGNSSPGDD